jgi:hypothetical protein
MIQMHHVCILLNYNRFNVLHSVLEINLVIFLSSNSLYPGDSVSSNSQDTYHQKWALSEHSPFRTSRSRGQRSASYAGGSTFESRPGGWLSRLRFIVVFLSFSRQILELYLELG